MHPCLDFGRCPLRRPRLDFLAAGFSWFLVEVWRNPVQDDLADWRLGRNRFYLATRSF